ncbi:hypothetical protein Mapa_015043 [Marchantia paleacea]|nr:hypothetical protein Mapa_015043 [Marchantia paleacea]
MIKSKRVQVFRPRHSVLLKCSRASVFRSSGQSHHSSTVFLLTRIYETDKKGAQRQEK